MRRRKVRQVKYIRALFSDGLSHTAAGLTCQILRTVPFEYLTYIYRQTIICQCRYENRSPDKLLNSDPMHQVHYGASRLVSWAIYYLTGRGEIAMKINASGIKEFKLKTSCAKRNRGANLYGIR